MYFLICSRMNKKTESFLLVLQPGPVVVLHSGAAVLRSGCLRHTHEPNRSQIYPQTKRGHLSQRLPLRVLQRQSSTPWGKDRIKCIFSCYMAHCNSHHKLPPFVVPDQQCLDVLPRCLRSGLWPEGDSACVFIWNRYQFPFISNHIPQN